MDIGGSLVCSGNGKGFIRPAKKLGDDYIVRYQKRAAGDTATGGDTPHKAVKGWVAHELTVRGGKAVQFTVGGAPSKASKPVQGGAFALPAVEKAAYRNIVLIPIRDGAR